MRWIQRQACCACRIRPSQNAHVKSRGAGGRAEHIVPLCHACHTRLHHMGIESFQARYDLSLTDVACAYQTLWVCYAKVREVIDLDY